ncbi:AAA family ATPase [Rheinheimera faecalis]
MIKSIKLTNFLSFSGDSKEIKLQKLNVIIGPNGSGKSNLLEAIDLLRGASDKINKSISDGGGVTDWLWKGALGKPTASLEVVADGPGGDIRYSLSFCEVAQRFHIVDETIESAVPKPKHSEPYIYYKYRDGNPIINVKGKNRTLKHEDIDPILSILAQRKDPDQYPEITYLGKMFGKFKLYREWSFGRYTTPRLPQKADLPNDILENDCSNLGLVLNRLRREPSVKAKVLGALKALYDGIEDYDVQIEGGTVQVFLQEGQFTVPATRLSDGTLRYLCLLAILCHPNPPPLICLEEPELGLHPDVLPTLAELLVDASDRTQLIVTTHSDVLIDAMTSTPEVVLVAEKLDASTEMRRLDKDALAPWLERYRLGELWTKGEIGGTRW